MNSSHSKITVGFLSSCLLLGLCCLSAQAGPLKLSIEQITFGSKHRLFGYIGQSLTTPWNGSERYIVSLESEFHDHMPTADEAAKIMIIDTHNKYKIEWKEES